MSQSHPQEIISRAIAKWKPKSLVALYSGGYDSAVVTHLLHQLDTHGLPVHVAAIDTHLAADGWREYVSSVASARNWDFKIYSSEKAWQQFLNLIILSGCPKSRKMHTFVFQKLKGRVIEKIHMEKKIARSDKTLFVSGMRRAESPFRKGAAEIQRIGDSNRIFAAPIVHWSQAACDRYRVEYGLPDNPFYETVKGSGDCQCNWGNFISMKILKKYSPDLATGPVGLINKISLDLHGFGWDSRDIAAQESLFPDKEEEVSLTTPFLCQGCSRAKVRVPAHNVEAEMLQRGLF